jgi:hypothetical protein
MVPKWIKTFLVLLYLPMFFPDQIVLADTGPKPTMEFDFKYDSAVQEATILSGILYECDQFDCSDAAPLEELGPQGLYCEPGGCRAIGYGFAPYHRLEITFSDGITRQSNIFETAGFDSKYTVTVQPGSLLVEARFSLEFFPRNVLLLVACACTLVFLVLLAVLIVFALRRRSNT